MGLRIVSALVATLMVGGLGASIVHNLDNCLSMVRDDGTRPLCCELARFDRIEQDRFNCCEDPLLSPSDPSASPSAGPMVPATPVQLVPIATLALAAPTGLAPPRGASVERPPDRSPPTDTTVILI